MVRRLGPPDDQRLALEIGPERSVNLAVERIILRGNTRVERKPSTPPRSARRLGGLKELANCPIFALIF
jgi:hypothetical protein